MASNERDNRFLLICGRAGEPPFLFEDREAMGRPTLRIFAYLALAVAPIGGGADAGVGDTAGGAVSSFGRLSPVQTVQSGDCWYDNGWNGPGYYPCGNEWNSRPDVAEPVAPIIIPAFRRHHRHSVVVAHPQAPKPIYPGAPSVRLGAGAPAIGASAVSPGWRRLGAGGAPVSPNFHPGAATVTPGFAGSGFYRGLGGGNFRQFHNAGIPHIGAPVSPGFAGAGGFHPGGAIGTPHIGAPASPGFAGAGGFHPGGAIGTPHIGALVSPGFTGAGGFHPGGAIGTPHIGAPASPSFAGVGTFHAGGGLGAPHIGAPASPGLAGGGFHGVGGAGVFQGGGAALGQGGIGHH
jgi:hypothetical protein